ncbi:ABC transporter permease [Microbacterium lushaniae]|uniref:ABC transporter permease n=1 Tax=Microbacterium lushaniae TaxID=2614639 RepID=A0A5J6L7Q0_9MICO|nr:ABC transporter permease [Microbacterium lushaniae]QEW04440.1 ABC transporter permease [Microbacterium lushaniae]
MAAPTPLDAAPATVRRTPPKPVLLVGLTAGLGVILAVLLMLFIMPSLKSGAHNLPIGLAGPSSAVTQVEEDLDAAAPGAYTTQAFASEAALRDAVLDRDVVGGIVVKEGGVDEGGVHALVAGAGSTAISATISGTAQSLAQKAGTTAEIEDVVPLPESDPTGVGIGGLAFPLVFGGIVPAVAFRKVFSRNLGWAVGGILAFAAVGGIVVAAVLMFLFGSITTAFWPVAAAMALGIAGLALPLAGLQEVFGGKGFTIGAMIMMFVGNPLAGIATGGAWLPAGLGAVGQILPPGAAGTLVRSAAYFGGAGGMTAGLTLAAWVAAGAILLAIGARRTRLPATSR